jgi:signal transduction histidine kinase
MFILSRAKYFGEIVVCVFQEETVSMSRKGHSSASIPLPWWRSHTAGYVASPLLVGIMTLARFFVTEPLFVWAPFCLIVVMVGFLWGAGPALLTMTLAILAINYFVIPQYELLTLNIWNDITLLGPFVFVQILIVLLAAQNAVSHRRILAAKQEIQAYAQSLEATNRQLERVNRLKDYFFTRAAHELRTPLTSILIEAQFALRRLNKAEKTATDMAVWRTHFENIEVRAHGLHSLVEDLIELYSLRSEETQLKLAACDMRDLCIEVIEEQRILSGRQIELQLPPEPAIIQADYERFRQVIVNIVDNAIKYAPESTMIQVRVRVESARALVEVHNDDSELSQEQQERIFEPFYRTPSAEASFKEGWGLGLTISKECVQRHGGRIWVESSEKRGVTFFVELPSQGVF